jgi:hypothetical protein
MLYVFHDSQRAKKNSRRRSQKTSDRGQNYGRRTALFGVHCKEEGPADFLLYSAGYQYGDSEVLKITCVGTEPKDVTSIQRLLTTQPSEEAGMATFILPAIRLYFTHLYRRSGRNGGGRWV